MGGSGSGRPPVPHKLLVLRGSKHAYKRRHEPKAVKGRPAAPAWLRESAKPIFDEALRHVEGMGIVAACDGVFIGRYAQTLLRYVEMERWIDKNGVAFPQRGKPKRKPDGTKDLGPLLAVVAFPHVNFSMKFAAELTRMEGLMGLNPAARARLAAFVPRSESGESDPGEKFFDTA